MLDTGFNGELSLPIGTAMQLGLDLRDVIPVELADGNSTVERVATLGDGETLTSPQLPGFANPVSELFSS